MIIRFKKTFFQELPFIAVVPAVLWQIIFLGVPLFLILYFSVACVDASWWCVTLDYYKEVINWVSLKIIMRSLVFAFGAASMCLLIGYPVAYFVALRATRYKNIFLFFLTLPFWTNFLVQVYSWFFLLERNGLVSSLLVRLGILSEPIPIANSIGAIFMVMVYCYCPFMIMPIYSVLEKLDKRLLEASSDLGATSWQTFTRITLPLSVPGIRTGFLLVLVPAFGEFAIPALLGGSKYMLVGSLISYYFLNTRSDGLGSAFTLVSGVFLISIALFFYYVCMRIYRPTQAKGAS